MSTEHDINRRLLLSWATGGLGSVALWDLLARDRPAGATQPAETVSQDGSSRAQVSQRPAGTPGEAADPPPHDAPKARRVIHLCLCGGLSQVDSFDYKPELEKYHGKPWSSSEKPETFFGQVGLVRKNDWPFGQRGQSGLWISDLFPQIAQKADELTVIRSMVADSANHTPATFQQNTGFQQNGFPVIGAWLSYGLGCLTDELPAYVVLPDARGYPAGGTINWSNGFLPARHQGVPLRAQGKAVDDLFPSRVIPEATERQTRGLLRQLNQRHSQQRGSPDALTARIRSYELAAQMQLAIPQVTDLRQEDQATQNLYGLNKAETEDFGRRCLLARRLLERGVRFVQLFSGGSFGSPRINWDGHEDVHRNHTREAARVDQPAAALLTDLRRRGMLEDTLVLFTTEFGRTPFTQSASDVLGKGRDHNMYGFSLWMAGAGLKPGVAYGATDDLGWKAVENPVHWPDFHATLLHLLGIDHKRLTFYHNGIMRRLTNVHGHIIRDLLA